MPGEGARLALEKAGMTVDDIDLIEINEAVAAMPLVSTLIMGGRAPVRLGWQPPTESDFIRRRRNQHLACSVRLQRADNTGLLHRFHHPGSTVETNFQATLDA